MDKSYWEKRDDVVNAIDVLLDDDGVSMNGTLILSRFKTILIEEF